MDRGKATATAHANIAFVKYWGYADAALHLPANPTISVNLKGLDTTTTVAFAKDDANDTAVINDEPADAATLRRVSAHLDQIRALTQTHARARVVSRSNFPAGAGLASSASAFAALTVAAATALELDLPEQTLTILARLGSGSASRSVPTGFVEWLAGESHERSFARSIAPPEHWSLCDCIAIVDSTHKKVGSREGHARAASSPLHQARVTDVRSRFGRCREAILGRDLTALGEIMEADAVMMHAVAMTSRPPIYYWSPSTLRIMRAVVSWRAEGLPVYYTIDAGPNVHCLCEDRDAERVKQQLEGVPGVREVRVACPGRGAHLVDEHLF